ncbi:MAG: type II secretion system secretin GspD [Alphaproteobacteria bacterium]|nr:type II secretion system secretin GspD [Alphaproteobacteria bacterium]
MYQSTGSDAGAGAAPGRSAGSSPLVAEAGPADVTLNFADTDIREVTRVILGTTLKLNYTIDPSVHGTATLDTGRPLPRTALLPTLETLLNQNGATLIRKDGLYSVVPVAAAGVSNAVTSGTSGAGAEVIVLRYASARDLAKTLQPYLADGSKLTADPGRNALIINGSQSARQAIAGLVRSFDVDTLAGQSFALFPASEGDIARTAAALEKALQAGSDAPLADLVHIVPLPRANAVLVASAQPRYLAAARRFFSLQARAEDASARSWHVYSVQNGQSSDLANLLQRAFTPGNVSASPQTGSTPPGADTATLASSGSLSNTGGPNSAGGSQNSGLPGLSGTASSTVGSFQNKPTTAGATPASGSQQPAVEALSGGTSGGNEERIRILANQRNNSLLIYATPGEYAMVEDMLSKVDITPLQVLIDATIAEVDLNGELQYGTQFFFKLDHAAETLGAIPAFPPSALAPTGLVGFAISKSPHFILQALSDVTKVRVLSAPQVFVMDNEPARLQVGQQVPILTGTATSTLTAGAPVVNSIDYHATGVIMQVTPHINASGMVTLDVAQEVSDVAPPAANTATGSPTFNDRILRTRVAVQNGSTVALAGLIRDNAQDDNNGIPFLKDVPLVSTLLSSQSDSRARTELLILITPHVVQDQRDARNLTEDLRSHLFDAAITPSELQRRPVNGRSNPNGL